MTDDAKCIKSKPARLALRLLLQPPQAQLQQLQRLRVPPLLLLRLLLLRAQLLGQPALRVGVVELQRRLPGRPQLQLQVLVAGLGELPDVVGRVHLLLLLGAVRGDGGAFPALGHLRRLLLTPALLLPDPRVRKNLNSSSCTSPAVMRSSGLMHSIRPTRSEISLEK